MGIAGKYWVSKYHSLSLTIGGGSGGIPGGGGSEGIPGGGGGGVSLCIDFTTF
tara:strand:+ start:1069 stop:1227 length:159 start_codon:yes stop_codon:yes gene_type:complete